MHKNLADALKILEVLGLPRAQQNERSALTLLALLNLAPERKWHQAENPLIGITPVMDWINTNYQKKYAPNTRETFRRQTMHQFIEAGMVLYNPDDPLRAVNSPKAVYRIEPSTLDLLRAFEKSDWPEKLANYFSQRQSLSARYAKEREINRISVKLSQPEPLLLTPGSHSELIKAIVEDFGSRFIPGGILVYVGDTGKKWAYFDERLLAGLGVKIDSHGKMPDVIIYYSDRNWLILVEAVTSHGPVDGKRHEELKRIFAGSSAGLVFVTAFPDRSLMSRHLSEIAWETEIWTADAPSHLIHFNGVRFLGPYK